MDAERMGASLTEKLATVQPKLRTMANGLGFTGDWSGTRTCGYHWLCLHEMGLGGFPGPFLL
ncbi:conserved hypothetical protein [Acidithiobacillus caldus SM-1]|uniref:Uncharacterized protein n=1 Tax=Acidithiobacillus caldus (strain SM-1) TaxID=990288 RepID=F9ZNB9_ACICS|nr:conserved hypothetical protein [Acidithiobacillus caldus SM-1]QER44603.1 hypothetical protein F0726_01532 [Acidithiobacillus caldus]